jgi:hypothetical protein
MRFEVNPAGPDELICSARESELRPELDTAEKITAALALAGGEITGQLTAALSRPQELVPRVIRMLTIQILRTEVISEISVPVPDGETVWVQ